LQLETIQISIKILEKCDFNSRSETKWFKECSHASGDAIEMRSDILVAQSLAESSKLKLIKKSIFAFCVTEVLVEKATRKSLKTPV
jgi:hypothetical protein